MVSKTRSKRIRKISMTEGPFVAIHINWRIKKGICIARQTSRIQNKRLGGFPLEMFVRKHFKLP
eukprot:11047964-Ditylum_brightwellii.AAC.1